MNRQENTEATARCPEKTQIIRRTDTSEEDEVRGPEARTACAGVDERPASGDRGEGHQTTDRLASLPSPGEERTSYRAIRLQEKIQERLCLELDIDPDSDADRLECLMVDASRIDKAINRAFFSGVNYKVYILNDDFSLNRFRKADAQKFLQRAFGDIANTDYICERTKSLQPSKTPRDQKEKEARRVANIPWDELIEELMAQNQRDRVKWEVDMFADEARMAFAEGFVRIILPHVPFQEGRAVQDNIIDDYKDDYKQHFPEVEEVLEMIVAARFASDRKKAFLWLLADSDWGKGFFTACLNALGLVVEMSVREIEKIFEGGPSGKSPGDFNRAWVLAVNEFKKVKSEVKQLENSIPLAPKHQLTSEVDVFCKLFMSAESVPSLVTEHGVEDQFSKRFSFMHKEGRIEERSLFWSDPATYHRVITAWFAQFLNERVVLYRGLGAREADIRATAFLQEFHKRYGISNRYKILSESIGELAEEFMGWLDEEGPHGEYIRHDKMKRSRYVVRPAKALEAFLSERKTKQEIEVIKRRKEDIYAAISPDGGDYKPHKINGKTEKGILLRESSGQPSRL